MMGTQREIDRSELLIVQAQAHHDQCYRDYNAVVRDTQRHDDDYYLLVADHARAVAEAIRRLRFARNDKARLARRGDFGGV